MLTELQLEQRLLDFTRAKLAPPEVAGSVTPDTRLFEQRVVDSLRILELIAFLEAQLGRKIPDAQVVLANFRTIRTMARVFTGNGEIAQLARGRRARAMGRSSDRSFPRGAVDDMVRRGEIEIVAPGEIRLHDSALALSRYFDDVVRGWAAELGAEESEFPEEIAMATLRRAGFVEAFPQKLVGANNGTALSPAVCYHAYPQLQGGTVDETGRLSTAISRCHREEHDDAHPLERLRAFTMREIIIVGGEAAVDRLRREMIERVTSWMRSLDLAGVIEVATDPFFTSETRGRMLVQQIRPLKYELRLSVDRGGRTIAAASFNDHQQHFGRAFDIRLAEGETAHSGCVAFGWERWVVAFISQHGADADNWPDAVRNYAAVA